MSRHAHSTSPLPSHPTTITLPHDASLTSHITPNTPTLVLATVHTPWARRDITQRGGATSQPPLGGRFTAVTSRWDLVVYSFQGRWVAPSRAGSGGAGGPRAGNPWPREGVTDSLFVEEGEKLVYYCVGGPRSWWSAVHVGGECEQE